jgi:integrase/recombinase XerD
MTPLRARFIAHLELKGYAAKTRRNYLDPVIQFSRWLKRSPDTLTKDDIQRYLLYLKRERKLAIRTLNIHIYALKAFCNFILPEADIMAPYSRLKEPKHNPMVLSREEINAVINTEQNLKYKAIVATLYSSGVRLDECINLKVSDIDSNRMIMRVHDGKGSKDRQTVLSMRALNILRDYWRRFRPRTFLFEGYTPGKPIHHRTVGEIVATAGFKAGLRRRISPHVMRLQVIQQLLGHEKIQTTSIYTHVSTDMLAAVKSPFDTKAPRPPRAEPPKKPGRPIRLAKKRALCRKRTRKGGRS